MPWELTYPQRFITVEFLAKLRLNAPVVALKPESAAPTEGAEKTVINDWLSQDDDRNFAIQLVDGHIELKIKAPDDIWAKCLFAACATLQVDARAAYGGRLHQISSILIRIEDPTTIDGWIDRWPRGHRDKAGGWVETSFVHSLPETKRSKAILRLSSPLPGSQFGGELVAWRPLGKPPAEDPELGLEELGFRPIAPTNMHSLCRAIAFATLGYWIEVYLDGLQDWDESLTRTIGGWIATELREGKAVNAHGKSLEGLCWAPVDSRETAEELIRHLMTLGASKGLREAYERAERDLERNPDAKIPGWRAFETTLGVQARIGTRRAFRAGLDLSAIERLAEQYVYDTGAHEYLDRDALLKDLAYVHKFDELAHTYENDLIFIGPKRKPLNPFRAYAHSSLRVDVAGREFYPSEEPGALMRMSRVHGLVKDEDARSDEYRLLNIYTGLSIQPIATIDPAVMGPALSMIDTVLGYLTQDNDAQMLWLKKFLAWTIQHPAIKQQVAPIIVGGQGIGKSRFGVTLLRALFGNMAGQADASALSGDKFFITPFLGKLVTFIDEVRLESVGAINAIKRLIREDRVPGQLKFRDPRDYYVPTRLIIATNNPDIGLTPEDAADRAFFFIVSWTAENKRMTTNEFLAWTLSFKPFYDSFMAALESVTVRQHLMRYFVDLEVERAELEDLKLSSRNDENIVKATMSKAREVAREIVADARVIAGSDITAWFTQFNLRDAIKRIDNSRTKVETSQVLLEYERARVIENTPGGLYRFKYGYGKLLKKFGEAHNLEIHPRWPIQPVGDDWSDNNVQSVIGAPEWRGRKQPQRQQKPQQEHEYDQEDVEY